TMRGCSLLGSDIAPSSFTLGLVGTPPIVNNFLTGSADAGTRLARSAYPRALLTRSRSRMSAIEQRVRAEQLRLLFDSPVSVLASALTVAFSAAVLWSRIDSSLLLGWTGATLAWLAIRAGLWFWFRRESADDSLVARWAGPTVAIMATSGLLWGLF